MSRSYCALDRRYSEINGLRVKPRSCGGSVVVRPRRTIDGVGGLFLGSATRRAGGRNRLVAASLPLAHLDFLPNPLLLIFFCSQKPPLSALPVFCGCGLLAVDATENLRRR